MKAIDLIPVEDRRGPGTAARSGGLVYVLVSFLALLLVGVIVYVLTDNTIAERRAQTAKVSNQASAAEAQAARLKPYADFAALEQARVSTVRSLVSSRFDWERALNDLSRVLPSNVWLSSFTGTVAPGVSLNSGGGSSGGVFGGSSAGGSGGSSLRGDLPVPAIELVGCTESQADVASLMSSLRLISGVTRVSLEQSEKGSSAGQSSSAPSAASSAGTGSGSSDCRHGHDGFPQFQIVVFFGAATGASAGSASSAAAGGAAPAATPATPSPAGSSSGAKPAGTTTPGSPPPASNGSAPAGNSSAPPANGSAPSGGSGASAAGSSSGPSGGSR